MTLCQSGVFKNSKSYIIACVIAAGLYSVTFLLNKLRQYNWSRLYFSIFPGFIIVFIGSSISGDTLTAYKFMLIGTIVCPLIIFEITERKYLIIAIVCALVSYFSFDFVNPLIPMFEGVDPKLVDNAENIAISSFVSYASLILGFVYLQRLNVKAENKLQESLAVTESQKKIISVKNQKLVEVLDITNQQKEVIEYKNKHIQDSINYSERIQRAMLPNTRELMNAIPDLFVFFEPKDVISGDFYWFGNKAGKKVIVLADCTGHGVPGALLSMIGSNILDRIIVGKGITNPGDILYRLDREICRALRTSGDIVNDGMDVAVCTIDELSNTIEFAGAKQSLIYIRENQLYQVKGDRESIGGKSPNDCTIFTNHELSIDEKTSFYLYSDGICDQFGGESGKKFMIKRLKQFIIENYGFPFSYQKELLKKNLSDWQGEEERVDDVLVIGFSPEMTIPSRIIERQKTKQSKEAKI